MVYQPTPHKSVIIGARSGSGSLEGIVGSNYADLKFKPLAGADDTLTDTMSLEREGLVIGLLLMRSGGKDLGARLEGATKEAQKGALGLRKL